MSDARVLVSELEREAAGLVGTKDAIALAAGSDAAWLALSACGTGAGDCVIVTPFASPAVLDAIRAAGARPVFTDVEERTFNMDAAFLPAAIDAGAKALILSHTAGHPAEPGRVLEAAITHGLALIEDCSESIGANYKFAMAGSFGDAAFLSFPEAWGEGGLILTDGDTVAANARETAEGLPGLGEEGAAAVLARLKDIYREITARRDMAAFYNERLGGLPGLTTPSQLSGYFHVYNKYIILAEDAAGVRSALSAAGINCGRPFPYPLDEALSGFGYVNGSCRVAEKVSEEALSLPVHGFAREEAEAVCRNIERFLMP